MAANRRFAADDFGGKCERGLPPFTKTVTTNRNSPPRAEGAQGSFDSRREAPGGSEGGLTSKHTYDEPPARIRRPPSGPLDLRRSAFQAVPALFLGQQDAVSRPSRERAAYCRARGKNKWQRTGGSLPAISGESVKGGYPLSQKQQRRIGTRRRAPPAARKGVSIPGAKRRAVRKGGSPPNTPTTNHPPESGAPLPDRSTLCRRSKPSPRFFSVGDARRSLSTEPQIAC